MPSECEEYLKLVCFIALMAARVPSARRMVDQVAWMIHRQIFDRVLQTRETWAAAVEEARAEGINLGNVSYDQIRDFFDRGEYTVRTDQNWQINMMLHTMGFIRVWQLYLRGSPSCALLRKAKECNGCTRLWT